MKNILREDFYKSIAEKRQDPDDLKRCVVETVQKLITYQTTVEQPGVLLGKIQGGKTRAFIGVAALAFDNEYDMIIILTKGTKALARQTYERLISDFKEFVEEDRVQIYDIMHVPSNLTPWELQQKLVMVVKKETNNLKRTFKALEETYPDLKEKRVLIIDDEADYASIGFRQDKNEGIIQINKIARQINELREKVKEYSFLQVTATPYSLYLQPQQIEIRSEVFKPVLPAFTVLLPIGIGYVGGNYYFNEDPEKTSISSFIYKEVPLEELEILKKGDRRSFRIEDVLTSRSITTLRQAVMNFIVGACIRRLQQRDGGITEKKYSFVVHTEQAKASHSWQEQIVSELGESLNAYAANQSELIESLIKISYENLSKSIRFMRYKMPNYEDIKKEVLNSLRSQYLVVTKVNSESEVEQLLDDKGQLKLRTPLNIFIGGQILDRGVTIDNLIGFYYGRRPKRFQQDTVLQHSRMYGYRPLEDLAVTRFYTARSIYETMRRINEFDEALREAFIKGGHNAGVVFIHKDEANQIIPCSPNKIMLSTITTLKPFKRLLPIGFQTDYKSKIKKTLDKLDSIIEEISPRNSEETFLIDLEVAKIIVEEISSVLIFEEGYGWDVKAFKASSEYLSRTNAKEELVGKVWCLVRKNRDLSRVKDDGSFADAPDTAKTEGAIAKETAVDIPILMLFRQNGREDLGWRGSPFWWPVLMVPKNTKTVIFSSELENETSNADF